MIQNIIFAGTPEISAILLEGIIANGYTISACYTQPDRPKGRQQLIDHSAVKKIALAYNIPLLQPKSLKDPAVISKLKELKPDLVIVFAYGLILPKEFLDIPKLGCLNVHTSLLPKWRGAAPVQHAIMHGDQTTGISIIKMNEGLDTGDVLYTLSCNIDQSDTSKSLYKKLQPLTIKAILAVLAQIKSNKLNPIPQEHRLATYAHKLHKGDAKINWLDTASKIERFIRALNPQPIAFSNIGPITIRIYEAITLIDVAAATLNDLYQNALKIYRTQNKLLAGTILNSNKYGIDIFTGNDLTEINPKFLEHNLHASILRIKKLQLPGGKVLEVAAILNSAKNINLFALGNKFD